MLNWLRNAVDRARATLEVRQIAARMDQIELEWGDVLDKLKAREDRERKRKKNVVEAGCVDCTDAATPAVPDGATAKLELWRKVRAQ